MEGHVDPVIPDPFLGGFGNTRVTGLNSLMTAMDIGVRETRAGDPCSKSASGSPKGVMGSDAEGGALGAKVPANPGEEFDAASESEEAHGL